METVNEKKVNKNLINISKHTFITALIMLVSLLVLSIILTYIIPRGEYGLTEEGLVDYSSYIALENESGINILKGIFAPILLLGSSDGITVIMLSIFLLVIAGAFQAMNDVNGIKSIVNSIVKKFSHKRFLLLAIIGIVVGLLA